MVKLIDYFSMEFVLYTLLGSIGYYVYIDCAHYLYVTHKHNHLLNRSFTETKRLVYLPIGEHK